MDNLTDIRERLEQVLKRIVDVQIEISRLADAVQDVSMLALSIDLETRNGEMPPIATTQAWKHPSGPPS